MRFEAVIFGAEIIATVDGEIVDPKRPNGSEYSYFWVIDGGKTLNITVRNSNGTCVINRNFTKDCILPPPPPECDTIQITDLTISDTLICSGELVQITADATGGIPPYTYTWYKNETFLQTQQVTGPATIADTITEASTYRVEVRSAPICPDSVFDSRTANIGVIPVPDLSLVSTTCATDNNSYCATIQSSTSSFTIAPPGTYDITSLGNEQYDICGIPSGLTIEVGVAAPSDTTCKKTINIFKNCDCDEITSLTIEGETELCEGDTTLLTANIQGGTTPYTINWSNEDNFTSNTIISNDNPIGVSPMTDTTYFLQVITADACDTAYASIFINMNSKPTIQKDSVVCDIDNGVYHVYFSTQGENITASRGLIMRNDADNLFSYVVSDIPLDQTVDITARFQNNDCPVTITCDPPAEECDCKAPNTEVNIFISEDTICAGNSINLVGSAMGNNPPFTYEWTFSDGSGTTNIGTGDSISFTPPDTGLIIVKVTDDSGCDSGMASDTGRVTVNPIPMITVDSIVCGQSGSDLFQLFFSSDADSLITSNGSIQVIDRGRYFIDSLDINSNTIITGIFTETGCSNSIEVPAPGDICPGCGLTLTIEGQTEFCFDPEDLPLEVELTASVENETPPSIIDWFNNPNCEGAPIMMGANVLFSVNSDTTFYVQITDADSCTVKDSVEIKLNPNPTIEVVVFSCAPDGGSYEVEIATTNTDSIAFNVGTLTVNTNGDTLISNIPSTEVLTIIAFNTVTGCMDEVTVNPKDECCFQSEACVDIIDPNRDCILQGDTTMLVIRDDCDECDYIWTPAGSLDDPTSKTPIASPQSTTTYMVEVLDENQCSICTDTATVVVLECGVDNFFFPDLFTPNGDGLNDVLSIRVVNVSRVEILIVNRFGQVIVDMTWENLDGTGVIGEDGNKGRALEVWDGTLNGRDVPPDVYGYYLTVTCDVNNERVVKQGNVTLLR